MFDLKSLKDFFAGAKTVANKTKENLGEADKKENLKEEFRQLRAKGISYRDLLRSLNLSSDKLLFLIKDSQNKLLEYEFIKDELISAKKDELSSLRKLLANVQEELQQRNLQRLNDETLVNGYYYISHLAKQKEYDLISILVTEPAK